MLKLKTYYSYILNFFITSLIVFSSLLFCSFFKYTILGTLNISLYFKDLILAIFLFILFSTIPKFIYKIDYINFKKNIMNSKSNFLNNLLLCLTVTFFFGLIILLVYNIKFLNNYTDNQNINEFIYNLNLNNNYYTNLLNLNEFIFSILYLIIIVLAEELFFRYYLYKIYDENIYIFTIFSSITFAFYHGYSIARIISSFILGLTFSIIYISTKNIVYSLISHFIWNISIYLSSLTILIFKNFKISMVVYNTLFIEIFLFFLILLLLFIKYLNMVIKQKS